MTLLRKDRLSEADKFMEVYRLLGSQARALACWSLAIAVPTTTPPVGATARHSR